MAGAAECSPRLPQPCSRIGSMINGLSLGKIGTGRVGWIGSFLLRAQPFIYSPHCTLSLHHRRTLISGRGGTVWNDQPWRRHKAKEDKERSGRMSQPATIECLSTLTLLRPLSIEPICLCRSPHSLAFIQFLCGERGGRMSMGIGSTDVGRWAWLCGGDASGR